MRLKTSKNHAKQIMMALYAKVVNLILTKTKIIDVLTNINLVNSLLDFKVITGFKDYRLSPPKKIVVKNIFYCFIKFLCPRVIVFEGVNSFVNIH